MKKIFAVMCISLLLICGCASFGKFTPQGGAIATNAVDVATNILKILGTGGIGIYAEAMSLKQKGLSTDDAWLLQQATKVLSLFDAAATAAKAIIAGATVTDEQLNVIAGQVEGAKAILEKTGG